MSLFKFNLRAFLLLFTVIFGVIFYKILHVPITHDEVATIFLAENESIWNILMYKNPIPNNHILNTLFVKFSLSLFGMNPFSVRLPNFLSFMVYSFAIYRLLNNSIGRKSWLFLPASLFFVTNPYLLDFFGLARGYALAIALSMLSISFLLSAFKENNTKNMKWGVFLAALSCYANFTLLYYFLIVLLLACFFFIIQSREEHFKRKDLYQVLAGTILFILLIVPPILRMGSTNQFVFWTSNGFIEETIRPLVIHSLYGSKVLFFQLPYVFLTLIGLVLLYSFLWSSKFLFEIKSKINVFEKPLFVASFIFFGIITINVLHVYLTEAPNLKNRTALFYFPLFILVLIFSLKSMQIKLAHWLKVTLSILASVLCILQISLNLSLYSVREWAYDQNTLQVIDLISKDSGDDVILATDWKFNPSFYYYSQTNQLNNIILKPYSKELEENSDANYYYIFVDDFSLFEGDYSVIKTFNEQRVLIKKFD